MNDIPPFLPRTRPSGLTTTAVALAIVVAAVCVATSIETPQFGAGLRALVCVFGLVIGMIGAILAGIAVTNERGRRLLPGLACGIHTAAIVMLGFGFLTSLHSTFQTVAQKLQDRQALAQEAERAENASGLSATEEIPQDDKAIVSKDVAAYHLGWAERTMLKPYDSTGKHDPRWDAEAHALIEGTARYWAHGSAAPQETELQQLGRKALAKGCDDPLIIMLAAFRERQDDPVKAASLFERAESALPAQHYSPQLVFLASAELYNLHHRGKSVSILPAARPDDDRTCLDTLAAALAVAPMTEADQWVWEGLLTADRLAIMENRSAQFLDVVKASPNVPEWLKLRVQGEIEVDEAWKARGSGSASEVTRKGWKGFEEHLRQANAILQQSWEANPKHPSAACTMIRVAMGQNDLDDMREWFENAVSARFDDPEAYQRMRWGLRARWLGSKEALLAFGLKCAKTERFDTDVPLLYLSAIHDQWSDERNLDVYFEKLPWAELSAMFKGYLKTPGSESRIRMIRTNYAILAEYSEHWEECREQLDALHDELDPQAARWWNQVPETFPSIARNNIKARLSAH